ncbi:DUF3203 family protein [Pseudomonas sp. LS44]|uniref:DUF3203 family protein n=1 Tax=Pseudomonas sp. LS44 TaxID=1357074 RepID=UPI00215AB2F7|nr:DUF3203 family protein [Pseudomonas sp. LS44]UVE16258.1 DUF3203 family protein [Pseudomonas sp. LS44]
MALLIDVENASCTITLDGVVYERPIAGLVILTDPEARMSQMDVAGQLVHITEDEARCLIGAGAKDDRKMLWVNTP